MRKQHGFTLIELMIVVGIVAILAAIMVPSYQNYTRKARRGDGMDALLQVANEQEKWFNNNNSYVARADVFDTGASDPMASEEGHYNVSVATANSGQSFTASAVAQGDQANDEEGSQSCATLTINNLGQKTPVECWR